MDTATAEATSGMVATQEGGFIVDEDTNYGTGDVEVVSDSDQDISDAVDVVKDTGIPLTQEQEEEDTKPNKETKRAYKSSKFGEVPEEVVEKLLAYKDRVQDLEKIEDVDKFRAEIQTAANKKFMAAKKEREEVAQEREAARSILDYAKANPLEFLQATGVNVNDIIRGRLEEDMRLAQMSPEQRQEYHRMKEYERNNREMQQKLSHYEAQMKQHQEQQMKIERQNRFNELAKMISQVHKEANLPESADVVQTILAEMQAASEFQRDMGIPVSSAKLMQNIKSRLYTDALKLIGSAESYEQLQPYDGEGKFRDALMKLAAGHATKNRTLAPAQPKVEKGKPRVVEAPARTKDEPMFLGDADLRRMKMRGEW